MQGNAAAVPGRVSYSYRSLQDPSGGLPVQELMLDKREGVKPGCAPRAAQGISEGTFPEEDQGRGCLKGEELSGVYALSFLLFQGKGAAMFGEGD